jgi:hypothetical protein
MRFDYLEDLEVRFRAAVLGDVNPLFQAVTVAFIQPLELAASLPDDHPRKLTDERAERALAKAYAHGVMEGRPGGQAEGEAAFRPVEWEAWLLEHRAEFASIRSVAEIEDNFLELVA